MRYPHTDMCVRVRIIAWCTHPCMCARAAWRACVGVPAHVYVLVAFQFSFFRTCLCARVYACVCLCARVRACARAVGFSRARAKALRTHACVCASILVWMCMCPYMRCACAGICVNVHMCVCACKKWVCARGRSRMCACLFLSTVFVVHKCLRGCVYACAFAPVSREDKRTPVQLQTHVAAEDAKACTHMC